MGSLGVLLPASSEVPWRSGPKASWFRVKQGYCPPNSVMADGDTSLSLFTGPGLCVPFLFKVQCPPPPPRRPNRGPGSRLAGLDFTFTAEPKTLGTHPILPKAATVVKNHHGFPKPQHSEYLPEQAGVFQNPACPDQSISLRRSVPQLWKMFPLPKTSSLEQDHRTTSQTATEPRSSWPKGDRKPSLFAEVPSLASKAQRVPDQTHSASSIPYRTLESQCHMTATSVGGKMHRKF